MAATPFDPSCFPANAFDIYIDPAAVKSQSTALPGGACNFADLSPGANGARCGCRRFWSRCAIGNLGLDQTDWCMCNHHACYHEEGDRDGNIPEAAQPGQENEKPRTGREPLSPVVDMALQTPSAVPGTDFPSFNAVNMSFFQRTADTHATQPRTIASPNADVSTSIPDTLKWGSLLHSQPAGLVMPPIPAQCLIASQTASSTSSMQAKYSRPFAGKGLHTLQGVVGNKPTSSLLQDNIQDDRVEAVPEGQAAQPQSFLHVTQDEKIPDTLRSSTPTQSEPRAAMFNAAVSRRAFKNLSDTVSGHDQRLDRLETVSFTVPGHDDCHEKHDHADIRMVDLETRVDEIERLVSDNYSNMSRRADDASVVSVITNASSRPTHSQELYSQVQSLQAQVVQLQSLIPTPTHPFEVEVVFLPFPLKKVWQESRHFKNEPHISSDDWTQLPMTLSTETMRHQPLLCADWASSKDDLTWLLPKACGDKSIVDRRLRSRGLVKTISVKGSDARSVTMAINASFGGIFREMNLFARPQAADPRSSTFLGLQSTWVPLRKIHKDSRLRFLSPAEMMTPAIWDVQFLSSVMMRASEPRLFITHPDAYLQDYQAYDMGWTWQMVKELNPFVVDVTMSHTEDDPSACEECWSWSEQLDESRGAVHSTNTKSDPHQTSSSPSLPFFSAVQTMRLSSPSVTRGQSPLLASRGGSRPPHIRTSSMPVAVPAQPSPALSKRRVASSGRSRRSSPAVQVMSHSAIMKRRRTRSPSHHRFTPRWTSSPSPMPFGLTDRQPTRGTTPFAYATPYSNAPLQEIRTVSGGSVVPAAPEEGSEDDPDFDVEIYESGSEYMYDDDGHSMSSTEMIERKQTLPDYDSRGWRLPEDEPWPGIEDRGHVSDDENLDPGKDGHKSNASSQPSEYPSTQSVWPNDNTADFHIHEDDENGS